MKKFVSLFLVIAVFVMTLSACSPVDSQAFAAPPNLVAVQVSQNEFLEAATFVMLVFASMTGVPLLISALVNLVKVLLLAVSWLVSQITKKEFTLSIDGYSNQIASALTLVAFFTLVYFRVFQPFVSFDWLDNQAKQIAELLNYLASKTELP